MSDFRQRLLATSILVGANLFASPALAQEVTPADQPEPTNQPGPATAPAAPTDQKEIIVTGSRIPQANLESAAPVTVVSSQDVKLSGTSKIEDILNALPSIGPSMTSTMSNGATGTAEVDLRYLSSKRTLSLINGRRLTPGDPNNTSQAADLNLIPASLVKRAEVLTGGASSVYGADAVAGVVNLILDTNFTGIRFDGQYSFYQHQNRNPGVSGGLNMSDILASRGFSAPTGSVSDGGSFDGTASFGAKFDDDRGHAVAYIGYRKVKPVLQGQRDYSACVIQNSGGGVPRCGGSATANPGTAVIFADPPGPKVATSTVAALGPGTITPFSQNLYNFAPLNHYQRPDERYIAGAFADYEISPAVKPYLEFMFMDDHTLAQVAPSGDFGNTLTINCDNPLMSAAQFTAICGNPNNIINGFLGSFPLAVGAPYNPNPGNAPTDFANTDPNSPGTTYRRAFFQLLRRNTEGGARISDLTHTSFRGVLGFKGDLGKSWNYDSYYQYGRTEYSQIFKNDFSAARLARALDVVADSRATIGGQVNPNFGLPVCRSVLDNSDPSCVPYDVFGSAASNPAVDYLNVFGVIEGRTSEQIAHADFTGSLGDYGLRFPWAEDGIGVNVGAEYRKETLVLNPDQEFQTGDLTGQGAPTLAIDGSFHVFELFGEAQIPIVRHSFIDEFSLGVGYRKSWYKLSNGRSYDTDTYKISGELAPIRDVRLRAAYNRAVRAPNIQELFRPQFVGLDGSNDPCATHAIIATDYGCIAQGLAIGQHTPSNPSGQYNGLLGGNPDVTPEKATTKTIGVVVQPRWIPRFALTLDYWNIDVKDAIQSYGGDAIINNCIAHSTATSTAPSCDLIHRNPAGSLFLTPGGFIADLPTNSAEIKTDGWDIGSSYSHMLGALGTVSTNFNGTLLRHYKVNNGLEGGIYDCAGLYGPTCSSAAVASSAPIPRWRHKVRTTLSMKNGLGLSLQWRMVGKVKAETLDDSETLHGESPLDPGLHIKAQHYFDLAATYSIGDHYQFRLGVNNVLDNDPPLVTSGNANLGGSNLCPSGPCNGNTYPGTWDALGRSIYAGVTLDF